MHSIIRRGSVGPDVKAWQQILGVPADGAFGPLTEQATRAWQHERGLAADGVVGPKTWAAANVAPPDLWPQGMDVSAVQGKAIGWAAERERGTEFVWARCHVGNEPTRDAYFGANRANATAAGVAFGGYLFPFPLRHIDPKKQAEQFVRSLTVPVDGAERIVGAEKGELPPAYDLEWPPPEEWAKWKLDADFIVDWSLACLAELKRLTGRPRLVVYSYPYELKALSKAKNYVELAREGLWIAGGKDYLNGSGRIPLRGENPPAVPGWGQSWIAWQHDGNGGRRLLSGVDADFDVLSIPVAEIADPAWGSSPVAAAPELDAVAAAMLVEPDVVERQVHWRRKQRAERIIAAL